MRIPEAIVRDALAILGHYCRAIEGGPRSRRQWARPKPLDEVRDSILRKLEVIERARRTEETARAEAEAAAVETLTDLLGS